LLVRVSVPEGYMNNSHKSDVHSAVNAAICDIVGDRSPNQGANVLVIIDEVPEGNWGARRVILRCLGQLRMERAMGIEPTGKALQSL
jgi:phenylpyruvate tautomerase PptA (4-oxalocrotonate tautomerase family)